MFLGISSFTFGWAVGVAGHAPAQPLDENGLLDYARELGVSLLQIGDNLPLHTFDTARLERLKSRAQRENVTLEVGARGLTPEHLEIYIELAQGLNARLLRFVIDTPGYEPSPHEVTTLLRTAQPALEAAQVTLGIENHDRFPVRVLRKIVDDANGVDEAGGVADANSHAACVGVCLDTANSLGAGEGAREVLAQLAPVTVNLHIKEFSIARVPSQMGFLVEGRPAGQGFMDWPAVLKSLPASCRTAVLEQWTPPAEGFPSDLSATLKREHAWARESMTYLRGLRQFALLVSPGG